MTAANADLRPGLQDLHRVPLPPPQAQGLARLEASLLGSAPWRAFKANVLRRIFGLEQAAGGRLEILALDARTDVRMAARLWGPVPFLPAGATEIAVADHAELLIRYPEALLRGPVPGASLVEIVAPRDVHHPNVSPARSNVAPDRAQWLCLGVNVPRAFPLHELPFTSYAALSLQAVTLDERDPAGVMNAAAVAYFAARPELVPLTREPFLRPRAAEGEAS